MKRKILNAAQKFGLDMRGKTVLTEAATGNYVVTSVIAACAGANVLAYTKDSSYGSEEETTRQTSLLAESLGVESSIEIVTNLQYLDLKSVDVVTNTGFLRPLNGDLINRLSSKCVIPLMWEPWEYREGELDLDACKIKGIKVYGTNESDKRLRTMEYLGFVALELMLTNKRSPFSCPNVLLIGSKAFVNPARDILVSSRYDVDVVTDYATEKCNVSKFDVIIVMENERNLPLIASQDAFIECSAIREDALVIHICGNVDLQEASFSFIPENPKQFGYMSYTTDYVDNQAVIDLHAAGLSVAEGMLKANA